jgi:peptidyl-prolyl cis-trans isomerase SurA
MEKRGDRVKVRHILRKPQYSTDNIKKMLLRLDSIASDIKEEKFTFEEGAEVISHDKETRNNYGMMYNKMTASSHFKMDELPVDVARVIDGLKVGEISQPFTWLQDNGKTVCAIVKLKSKTDAHVATLADDYETLQGLYQAKLSDERIREWIKEKQQNTYVRINRDSHECDFLYPDWKFFEE